MQRLNGISASGNSAAVELRSETVLSVGDSYVTYDSTAHDSALWLAHPAETFRSWFLPPPVAPFRFEPLVRWNDSGRVVWSNTGAANADLLIELATQAIHRLAIVRVTCSAGTCGASARERGLIAGTTLWVGDDGTSLVLSDTSLTMYKSIAELMNGEGEVTLQRLTSPGQEELAAVSRNATVILSNPSELSGEIVEGQIHQRMRLTMDIPGTGVAMMMNNNFRILIDTSSGTHFWDCPSGVLTGSSQCEAYTAPPELSRARPVDMSDTDCGIVISRGGWTWLLRRNAKTEDVFQADGIAACREGQIQAYRGRQIVNIDPKRTPVTTTQQTGSVALSEAP